MKKLRKRKISKIYGFKYETIKNNYCFQGKESVLKFKNFKITTYYGEILSD